MTVLICESVFKCEMCPVLFFAALAAWITGIFRMWSSDNRCTHVHAVQASRVYEDENASHAKSRTDRNYYGLESVTSHSLATKNWCSMLACQVAEAENV